MINERNPNADSYYVSKELVDTELLELLFPPQELSKSVPAILISDSLNDSSLLNESETPVMPKWNNSIKSPKRFKKEIRDKIAAEKVITILENMGAGMIPTSTPRWINVDIT